MTPKEQEKLAFEQKKVEAIEKDLFTKGIQINVTQQIFLANLGTLKEILIEKGICTEFEYNMKYMEVNKKSLTELLESVKDVVKKKLIISKDASKKLVKV